MSYRLTADEVRTGLREQLAVVLSIPPGSIAPESRILVDLDAESLDLLDLYFRLEDAFHVRLASGELASALGDGVTNEEFRERFTVEALTRYVLERLEQLNEGE